MKTGEYIVIFQKKLKQTSKEFELVRLDHTIGYEMVLKRATPQNFIFLTNRF